MGNCHTVGLTVSTRSLAGSKPGSNRPLNQFTAEFLLPSLRRYVIDTEELIALFNVKAPFKNAL